MGDSTSNTAPVHFTRSLVRGITLATQVHGLNDKAMHLYMAQEDDPLRIVRGGIFGGQLPHIECVLKVSDKTGSESTYHVAA